MSKISFHIDKKKVTEGEYVTVSWDCQNPDMVSLVVADGSKSVHQLGDSGTKVIPASGNADQMVLTLRATIGGKLEEKSAKVKVKRKVLKADKVSRGPKNQNSKPFDFTRIKDWWTRTTAQYKTAWAYMPETKKLAVKVMGLIAAVMILSGISPKLLPLGLLAVAGYLSWIILKR